MEINPSIDLSVNEGDNWEGNRYTFNDYKGFSDTRSCALPLTITFILPPLFLGMTLILNEGIRHVL
jgi:hypothetical protein